MNIAQPFDITQKSTPDAAQLQKELEAKGVKYCIGAYVDIHGVPKAKVVPITHLKQMAKGSERYTGYALDGLGQAPNEDELTSMPDFSRMIQLPWEPKIAWIPSDNHFQGKPYPLNTRVRAATAAGRSRQAGLRHEPRHRVRSISFEAR